MLEKIATVGSNRRRTEPLPALRRRHMPSSSLSLHAATDPIRASALPHIPANREFFARFLLDTHCPSQRCSTRHSDTSRNGRKFSGCSNSVRATRHLNATLVTRHSKAKIQPFSHSLFFLSALQIRSAFVFFRLWSLEDVYDQFSINPASSARRPHPYLAEVGFSGVRSEAVQSRGVGSPNPNQLEPNRGLAQKYGLAAQDRRIIAAG
jgi:hypothetical protein